MSPPWLRSPELTVDLDRPLAEQFADDETLAACRGLLEAVRPDFPPQALELAEFAATRIREHHLTEIREIADAAGVDWREVMCANLSYDIVLASFGGEHFAQLGCSTVALATADGPVLARNMDWWPEEPLAKASRMIHYTRSRDVRFSVAGWPGGVGVVSGASSRGFALALNAVAAPEPFNPNGQPVLFDLRRVLESATGFDEAVAAITESSWTVGGLVTLIGTDNNDRICIEKTPTRTAIREANPDEPLVTTNDYIALAAVESPTPFGLLETSCTRFDALTRFFASHPADVSDEQLLYALSDESVIQLITAQHMIFRPARSEASLFVPARLL